MSKINLNDRRTEDVRGGLGVVYVRLDELPNVDLSTLSIGDEVEGLGTLNDHSIIGFLHHCSRHGVRLDIDR